MAKTAQEYLTSWRQSFIYAEARPPEGLDEAVAECVADAGVEGLTREELEKAAGGDLRTYIQDALTKAGGGDA
ncbi:MAG: hypothetical protein ABI895_42085 [Deltaproteobacteria bacterium]